MIKINVVAVGKVKEKYFADGILEYAKRLSRFVDFNMIEVQEENYTKTDDGVIKTIKESALQLKCLPLSIFRYLTFLYSLETSIYTLLLYIWQV